MNFIFLTILLFYFGDVFEICSGSPAKMTMDGGSMSISTDSETTLPPTKGPCLGFEHNDKCYSLPKGECQSPGDCLSTSYSCESGTCKNVDRTSKNEVSSLKPGVSSRWVQDENAGRASEGVGALRDHTWLLYVCRVSKSNALTPGKLLDSHSKDCHAEVDGEETNEVFYELLIGSNVGWISSLNYNPAKAVYGGHSENGTLYLICRTKHGADYTIGKLEAPHFNECIYGYDWKIYEETTFDVLVEN